MRDAYLKWLIFEKRTDSDTLWVGFQAGWRFRDQQAKRHERTEGSRVDSQAGTNIMDLLANGTMENT